MPDHASTPVNCLACQDTGHVCENHPTLMWGGLCCNDAAIHGVNCTHGACSCGGMGLPCPACCTPIRQDGTHNAGAAFVPDRERVARA